MNFIKSLLHNQRTYVRIIIGVIIFCLGTGFGYLLHPTPDSSTVGVKHLGRTTFTNPVLDVPSQTQATSYTQLKKRLEVIQQQFLNQRSVDSLSIYFQDLETGAWFGINETERYVPASLMKVTLLVSYYKLAETNPELLREPIYNDGSFLTLSNVPPAQRLAIDSTYSVNELLHNMIVHSNNEAQGILSAYLASRFSEDINAKLITETMALIPASYERGEDFDLTVVDYAGVFRILYNTTYLSEQLSEQALALLAQSSYDSGIVNGVPESVVTANKFGFKNDSDRVDDMQFHDCGIIYAEPNPYILCIMTKTTDPVAAQKAVSQISREIYTAHTQPQ